jgi:tripartite motif-containing protein 2/3
MPHTVVPFSIAIKRMSEILLYKAKLCIKKLNEANAVVSAELAELDARASATQAAISSAFDDILDVIEERRQELLSDVNRMAAQKRAVLVSQVEDIRRDRSQVEAEVDALHHEVEVSSWNILSKYLNG